MDRQTLVLGSGVVALVAAPGADAITKTWVQQTIIVLPCLEPEFGSVWAGSGQEGCLPAQRANSITPDF